MEQTPQSKKTTIRTFAAASFLNDMGSDMIYPIWPMFVTSVLGANMAVLGLIDGIGDAIVSLSSAGSGYLSDKARRRKVFIWLGYVMASVSRIGYASALAWQHLVPLRVLDRMGKIRTAPRDAMVADVSTSENRGHNFGLLRTMDNLGAVCGILLCLFFFDIGYRNLFLLAAVPSVAAALLVLFVIRESPGLTWTTQTGLSLRHIDRNLWLFVVLSAVFTLGSFSYSFLLLYAKGAGVDKRVLPALYLVFTAVAAIFSLPFGRLADRVGRKPVLLVSSLFWATVCAAFIWTQNVGLVFLLFVLYGLHRASLDTVQRVFVADLAPPKYRASTLGGFQLVTGVCALPASLLAGILWDGLGARAPLYFSIVVTLASMVLLLLVKESRGGLRETNTSSDAKG